MLGGIRFASPVDAHDRTRWFPRRFDTNREKIRSAKWEQQMFQVIRQLVLLGVSALVLSACGGGGGSNTTSSDANVAAQPTGLVPASGPVGPILFADATQLRPFRVGAAWTYRGTRGIPGDTRNTNTYQTTTTQLQSATGIGVTESSNNSGDQGPDSLDIKISNGSVMSPQLVDFAGKGQPVLVNAVELQSPVLQGDQRTLVDRRFTNTAIDIDGDGKGDDLDVAIYTQVIGIETVALENLPFLKCVRVDTVTLTRVKASSTGVFTPIESTTRSAWYVPGLGLIRQRYDTPQDGISQHIVVDEQLLYWDGLTEGFGAMPARFAVIPTGNSDFPGTGLTSNFGDFHGAFAFADHILVATRPFPGPQGTLMSRMDFHGSITSATFVPNLSPERALGDRLVAHASGLAFLHPVQTSTSLQAQLTRLNADGQLIGNIGDISIDLGGGRTAPTLIGNMNIAADGSTLWLMWARYYQTTSSTIGEDMVLRAFDIAGHALTPEIYVPGVSSVRYGLTARDGKALIHWGQNSSLNYAVVSTGTAGLNARILVPGTVSYAVTPLILADGVAFLWETGLTLNRVVPFTAGVRLDAGFVLQLGKSGGIDDELLVGVPTYNSLVPAPQVNGGRIVASSLRFTHLHPQDYFDQSVSTISWLDVGAAPLSSTTAWSIRSAPDFPAQIFATVVLADRVILFGGSTSLQTSVVWLNNGSLW
jgi:hypothetical protein